MVSLGQAFGNDLNGGPPSAARRHCHFKKVHVIGGVGPYLPSIIIRGKARSIGHSLPCRENVNV